MTRLVHQHVEAEVVSTNSNYIQYQISVRAASGLSSLFAAIKVCVCMCLLTAKTCVMDQQQLFLSMQEGKTMLPIADMQIRLTPLEEVFMAIVNTADMHHATAQSTM